MRAALLLSLITCTSALAASKYTDHMYRKAVDDDSTSPLYLLFTLHDPKTGADRVVCAPGIGLVGAIHFEHHLDFDEVSRKAARRIALSQPRHRFIFSNRKALHNVRPYYSEKVLTEVRQLLARKSNSQLIHEGTSIPHTLSTRWMMFTRSGVVAIEKHIKMPQRTFCLSAVFSSAATIGPVCFTLTDEA